MSTVTGPGAGTSGCGGQRWLSVDQRAQVCVFGVETKEVHLWGFLGEGEVIGVSLIIQRSRNLIKRDILVDLNLEMKNRSVLKEAACTDATE